MNGKKNVKAPDTQSEPNNEFLIQRFGGYQLLGENLGKGTFTRVELAKHILTNTKVALKIVKLTDIESLHTRKNVLRETAILKTLRHNHIVRLYETLAHDNTYCFVIEYLEGGNLYDHLRAQKLKKFTEKQSRFYFVQLLYAIQYLHSKGIIHRDLKLQSMMLSRDRKKLKLGDFGLSNHYNTDEALDVDYGSVEYAAPELFDKCFSYGPASEIWSIGVVLYIMVTGSKPFRVYANEKRENFIAQVRRGMSIAHEDILRSLQQELKKLLIDMLEPDLDKRTNLSAVMSDVWVTENSKNPLLPQPPDVVPHDVRRKVIERVAELYSKPIPDTIKDLSVNHFNAMHATYQILLDKSVWVQRTQSNTKHLLASLLKRDVDQNTRYSHKHNRAPSAPILNTKYNSKQSNHSDFVLNKRSLRPQSARPDRRMKSTLDNLKNHKFCDSNNSSPNVRKESVDMVDSDSFFDISDELDEIIREDIHPVASCLKITKKSPCYERRSRSYSPPCNSFFTSSDNLEQTPFRLSRVTSSSAATTSNSRREKSRAGIQRTNKLNDGAREIVESRHNKSNNRMKGNVVESSIEGVFEFNSNDVTHGGESDSKVSVESDKIRVTISGHKISGGSFKIIHERPVRKHEVSSKKSDLKPCIRCLTPFEARQMLHRDTFPVKHTFMKPQSTDKLIVHNNNIPKHRSRDSIHVSQEPAKLIANEMSLQDEITANIISTPDSLMRILSNNNNCYNNKHQGITPSFSSRGVKCTLEMADEILAHEDSFNTGVQPRRSALAADKCDTGQKYHSNKLRRVSFKE